MVFVQDVGGWLDTADLPGHASRRSRRSHHPATGGAAGHQHRPDDSAVGSLAALLWRERCRARGQHIPALKFAGIGLSGVPIILTAAWATLLLTG